MKLNFIKTQLSEQVQKVEIGDFIGFVSDKSYVLFRRLHNKVQTNEPLFSIMSTLNVHPIFAVGVADITLTNIVTLLKVDRLAPSRFGNEDIKWSFFGPSDFILGDSELIIQEIIENNTIDESFILLAKKFKGLGKKKLKWALEFMTRTYIDKYSDIEFFKDTYGKF